MSVDILVYNLFGVLITIVTCAFTFACTTRDTHDFILKCKVQEKEAEAGAGQVIY